MQIREAQSRQEARLDSWLVPLSARDYAHGSALEKVHRRKIHPKKSGKKKEPKPKLFGPDVFRWDGVLLCEGVGGQKVLYVPRNPRKPNFLAGYPRILPGYPGGARKV